MTSKVLDKLVDPYNDLLSEVEKLILWSVVERSTAREKFKKRMEEAISDTNSTDIKVL